MITAQIGPAVARRGREDKPEALTRGGRDGSARVHIGARRGMLRHAACTLGLERIKRGLIGRARWEEDRYHRWIGIRPSAGGACRRLRDPAVA